MKLQDLHVEPLFESEFVLVANRARIGNGTVRLASLQHEQWVLPETNMGYYSELLTTLQRSGIRRENIVNTDSVVTIYNLVLNADFLTVIPCDMTTPFGSSQFVTIPIKEAFAGGALCGGMVEKLPVKNRRGVAGGDGETLFLGAGQPPLAAITNYCVTESR